MCDWASHNPMQSRILLALRPSHASSSSHLILISSDTDLLLYSSQSGTSQFLRHPPHISTLTTTMVKRERSDDSDSPAPKKPRPETSTKPKSKPKSKGAAKPAGDKKMGPWSGDELKILYNTMCPKRVSHESVLGITDRYRLGSTGMKLLKLLVREMPRAARTR